MTEQNNKPKLVELKIDDRKYLCLCDIKRTSMEITRGFDQYGSFGETVNIPTDDLSIKLNLEGRLITNKLALNIELPYPPSVNHSHYGNHHTTKAVRDFRAQVRTLLFIHKHKNPAHGLPFKSDVQVWIELYLPDRRRRDSDNPIKPLWDALTLAGVWLDDSQVLEFNVKRFKKEQHNFKKGLCIFKVEEIKNVEKE